MNHIIPAIIPTSAEHLIATVRELTFAQRIQVDIVDGSFVPSVSWPYEPAGEVSEVSAIFATHAIMVDIMATDQMGAARAWVQAGAKEIVVHLEAVTDIAALRMLADEYECALWVAGNDTLPVAEYIKIAEVVDGVQLMGIHTIGKQGEPFSDRVIANITALKDVLPDMPVMVDGSVNADTLPGLVAAGATHFVVGSAMMQAENPETVYGALEALV